MSNPTRTQWRVTATYTNGREERLAKDIFDRAEIFDTYEAKEDFVRLLLTTAAVSSIKISTRLVTEWGETTTLARQWAVTSV